MKHAWDLGDLEEEAAYFDLTPDSPDYPDFVKSAISASLNSYAIPCFVGYGIIGAFCIVVLVATILRLLARLGWNPMEASGKSGRLFQRHISEAPLIGKRHAAPWETAKGWLSFQMPLRGESVLLVILSLANFIPLVGVYTYYQPNLYYNSSFDAIARYLADRSGILSNVMLAPTIILAGRNNPITTLTGASFSTCQFWHRWFARWTAVHAIVHSIAWSVMDGRANRLLEDFKDPYWIWGVVSTCGMGLATFLSLRYLRRAAYELFVITHIIFAVAAVVGVYYHVALLETPEWQDFPNYSLAAAAFWAFDRVARILRMLFLNFSFTRGNGNGPRVSKSDIYVLSTSNNVIMIRVRLAGQAARLVGDGIGNFVQLWIPRVQPLSSHPFTVLRIDKSGEKGEIVHVVLAVRVYKGITERLAERAQKNGGSCQLIALAEGMYGEPVELNPYRDVQLVGGGLGITAVLPYFVKRTLQGKEASMIWVVRNLGTVQILTDYLNEIESLPKDGLTRKVTIFVTRPSEVGEDVASSVPYSTESTEKDASAELPKTDDGKASLKGDDSIRPDSRQIIGHLQAAGLRHNFRISVTQRKGRPDLNVLLADEYNSKAAIESGESNPAETAVVCCGPHSMCDDVRYSTRQLELSYHEELFDW